MSGAGTECGVGMVFRIEEPWRKENNGDGIEYSVRCTRAERFSQMVAILNVSGTGHMTDDSGRELWKGVLVDLCYSC